MHTPESASDGAHAPRPYHHGDLAAALMDAGEAELQEKGIEAFSLRGVAKRAGVSHAAPAHHFKDVVGLLTAIAARGYDRFVARQSYFRAGADSTPQAQMAASGVGYVAFAMENPALFRLMFGSDRLRFEDPQLGASAGSAYDDLVRHVAAVPVGSGTDKARGSGALDADIAAVWAMAHGLADLLAAGRIKPLQSLPLEERHRVIASLMLRVLPRSEA